MTEQYFTSRMLGILALAMPVALLPVAAMADAKSEAVTAAQHAGFAAAASDISGTHAHLHHALNCLVGPNGKGFDKTNFNPCAASGIGAISAATDENMKKVLEKAAGDARMGIAETDPAKAKADARQVQADLKAITM